MPLFELEPDCVEHAQDPWRPRPERRRSGKRVNFFRSPLIERLTLAHPLSPPLLLAPLLIWWSVTAVSRGVGPGAFVLCALVGLITWTLFEYLLHRFALHLPTPTPHSRVAAFLLHGHHHTNPEDPRRLVATPLMWGSAALLLGGVFRLIAGPVLWRPALVGAMLGYLAYEAIHWSAHHRVPRTRAGRWLRRYHLRHHFEDHACRFGISSPLWDRVFGTYRGAPEDDRDETASQPR